MTVELAPDDPRLEVPLGSRVFHAGMPKTGTTALQRTLAAQRGELLAHGTRYPGSATSFNHRRALYAALDRPLSWSGRDDVVPGRERWTRLVDEVAADRSNRVLISVETLSESPADGLRRILEELKGEAHVVLTLRSLPAQLASSWQQYLKSGLTTGFDAWLRQVLDDGRTPKVTKSFRVRSDVDALVGKWAGLVGEERVTLVVLDPQDRALLPRAFESTLALPSGMLEPHDEVTGVNRSFTWGEAELLREINRRIRDRDVRWPDYERLVRGGMVDRLLDLRVPGPHEQRIVPPAWAVERMVGYAQQQIEALRRRRVRVVGDLAHLATPVASSDGAEAPAEVAVDAAAEAVLGMLSAGLGRGNDFGDVPARSLDDVPASSLARALAERVSRRASTASRRMVDRVVKR
ncbi:hypothetical protein [Amnibacterium endophyticum]|uniref:Sulfotransferase family protein n=1 Tax=Amnibacterium endophyticum TaxID=2109337 RepID=A0ABW4LBH8_9MICO